MSESETAASIASELTPIERDWLAADPHDPRPTCPNRQQHAVVAYGKRWAEGSRGNLLSPDSSTAWPRLDGKSVRGTHRQVICEGCGRYSIWLPKQGAPGA